ncbi:MAG: hypothetical protein OEY34_08530, partial [Cyclobacteriaceae bacterium]|nr:hypothetical protein [Cyclobacteriaceae bacterium]
VKRNANLDDYLDGPSLEILLQIPEVLKAVKEFNMEIYGEEIPNYSKLSDPVRPYLMNMFGILAVYKIPDCYLSNARTMTSSELYIITGETTCSCTSGTSGCTYDSGFGWEMCESGASLHVE